MDLFIRIQDGTTVGHPIMGDNFAQAFPEIDTNNLPPEFARFVRIERPVLEFYQIFEQEEPTYELVDGVWTDVWRVREMTDEEKAAKVKMVRTFFDSRPQAENWSAWVFDETTHSFVSPIPRPEPDQTKLDAGIQTFWCGADNNWKDTPAKPVDENQYKFDFIAWQWVQDVN